MKKLFIFFTLVGISVSLLSIPITYAATREEVVTQLQGIYANFDGIILCEDAVGKCQKITRDVLDNDLTSSGSHLIPDNSLSFIASSVPVHIILSSVNGGSGPRLDFTYKSNTSVVCRHDFVGPGRSEGDGEGPFDNLPCTDGEGDTNGIITASINSNDGTKVVQGVYLPYLCLVSDTGQSCSKTWSDSVTGYSVMNVSGESTGGSGDGSGEASVGDPGGVEMPLNLASKINNLYVWMVSLAGLVALGIIVYGGVLYAASAGNPSRISDAKTWITGALLGLSLLLGAYILLRFVNPDLTKLEDVFLTSNPTIGAPGVEALSRTGFSEDCSGFYTLENAPKGNFGDTACEYAQARAEYMRRLEIKIGEELKNAGFDQYPGAVDRLTRIFYDDIIYCESGYYPNAYLGDSTSGLGAYGLLQMNPSSANRQYDIGDVPWREQILNGIKRHFWINTDNHCDRGDGNCIYWACWPENEYDWLGSPLSGEELLTQYCSGEGYTGSGAYGSSGFICWCKEGYHNDGWRCVSNITQW